jgi:hypothetical protein
MLWRASATIRGIKFVSGNGDCFILNWSAVFALLAQRPKRKRRMRHE